MSTKSVARLAALMLITVLVSPVASPAAETRRGLQARPQHPPVAGGAGFRISDGTASPFDGRDDGVADIIRQAFERLGTRALESGQVAMEATRLWAEKAFDVRIPTGPSQGDLRKQIRRTAESSLTFSDRFALSVGDVDGDGRDDVADLSYRVTINWDTEEYAVTENSITFRRGSDGSAIWSLDLLTHDDAFAFPIGDMTGDGITDVLKFAIDFGSIEDNFACDPAFVSCVGSASATWTWTLSALSGATGAAVWTNTYAANETLSGAFADGLVAGAAAVRLTGDNVLLRVFNAGNVDAPGSTDLVVNAFGIDITEVFTFGSAVVALVIVDVYDVKVASVASIVEGATGATIRAKTDPMDGTEGILIPVGDAAGNATPDFAWLRATYTPGAFACAFALILFTCEGGSLVTSAAELIDGSNLATVWTRDFSATAWEFLSFLDDLTGDGKRDVLVETYPLEDPPTISMLSGTTGQPVWSRAAEGYVLEAGPVGGLPGNDLILLTFEASDLDVAAVARRLDGPNGTELFASSTPIPYDADAYVYPMEDVNGDGVRELVVDITAFNEGGLSGAKVESGSNGAALWSRTIPGAAYSMPAGDLDDDGRADVMLVHLYGDLALTAVSVTTDTTLWTRSGDVREYSIPLPLGNTDGIGGNEIAYMRYGYAGTAEDEIYGARFDVLAGTTGAILYGFGDTLIPGGGGGGGDPSTVQGVVSDSNGPIEGIRVDIWADDGYYEGGDITAADGTWSLSGFFYWALRVRFTSPDGGHVGEWHLNKQSFETADDIIVAPGGTLTIATDLAITTAPENDDVADAATISTLPYETSVNLGRATQEQGEECAGEKTAWYRYVPNPNLPFFAGLNGHPSGEPQGAAIGLYAGESPESLTLLDCGGSVTALPGEGTTYWIQVGLSEGPADVSFWADILPR